MKRLLNAVDFSEIVCVQAMSDGSIVACEKQITIDDEEEDDEDDNSTLTKYSWSGTVLKTTALEEVIQDIAEVTLDGNQCIALAY